MMTSQITICIAHKHTKLNDAALRIALDCIVTNTVNDYALLVDTTTPEDPYAVYNRLAKQALTPYLLFTNSDVFLAPKWDVAMLEAATPETIVSGVLIEPGTMSVAPNNVAQNFGKTPETFDRAAFEAYRPDKIPNTPGWYMPALYPRELFVMLGGFDTGRGAFMEEPIDKFFWEVWTANGFTFKRAADSRAYHLQNWSRLCETQPLSLKL